MTTTRNMVELPSGAWLHKRWTVDNGHEPRAFDPVNVDFSKVSPHWEREVARHKQKGSRWNSPRYQAATRKDTERAGEFNHKASHMLRSEGFAQPAAAKVLGITERMVRRYQSAPCPSLEAERNETLRRARREHFARTKQGRAPFDVWAYLRGAEVPLVVDLLGFDPWGVRDIGSTTREKVVFYLMDGWSQAEICRLLGMSRQAVAKHVKAIWERVEIDVRKRAIRLKRS